MHYFAVGIEGEMYLRMTRRPRLHLPSFGVADNFRIRHITISAAANTRLEKQKIGEPCIGIQRYDGRGGYLRGSMDCSGLQGSLPIPSSTRGAPGVWDFEAVHGAGRPGFGQWA